MPYTPPTAGATNWDVTLNQALSDINTDVVAAQQDANDLLAGGGADIINSETTTSTSYVDLGILGPTVSVTLAEARSVLVLMKAEMLQTATTDDVYMSFAASGATVVSALDSRAVRHNGSGTAEAYASFYVVACNAGTTTFTAKYRVDAGTGQFSRRSIAAIVT